MRVVAIQAGCRDLPTAPASGSGMYISTLLFSRTAADVCETMMPVGEHVWARLISHSMLLNSSSESWSG